MKILVTVTTSPSNQTIHKTVVETLLKMRLDKRYDLTFLFPSKNPIENNLNNIVNTFMSGYFDFWLNIDSDNPPMKNPLDLVEYNKDIIGLPTPVFHFTGETKKERPVYWNIYDYVPEKDAYTEHQNKQGCHKVDAVGGGCNLISRRVFENPNMRKGAFNRQFYKDGTVHKGNDIMFCERANANGFEIYAHFDYPCKHFSNLELTEVVESFRNLYE